LAEPNQLKDRFFASVFFGSALLFLAVLFAAAVTGAVMLVASISESNELISSANRQPDIPAQPFIVDTSRRAWPLAAAGSGSIFGRWLSALLI
jgi:hypothetical protein